MAWYLLFFTFLKTINCGGLEIGGKKEAKRKSIKRGLLCASFFNRDSTARPTDFLQKFLKGGHPRKRL